MQKVINIIYIFIIIIQLFLFTLYIEKTKEEEKTKVEINSINYLLNKGNKYNEIKDNKEIIDYKIVLEIPSIKLKRGILSIDDKDNNIEKNVTILSSSSYPNENGNIFLAAHSGNGNKSYFNNLVYLKENDQAVIYYKEKKYVYYLKEIKIIDKKEFVSFSLESTNNLILITCSQKEKNKYIFFIFNKKTEN